VNLRIRRLRRKTIALLATGTVLLGGVTALAYFVSQATGSTQQSFVIGTASNIAVNLSVGTVTGSALTPAGPAQTATVKAQNPSSSSGNVEVTLSTALKSDGTGIFDNVSGTYVDSCLASWFSLSWTGSGTTVTTPVSVAPGTNATIDTLSLKLNDSGTIQDACEGLQPVVTVTAS
jgi:hypothetical protein